MSDEVRTPSAHTQHFSSSQKGGLASGFTCFINPLYQDRQGELYPLFYFWKYFNVFFPWHIFQKSSQIGDIQHKNGFSKICWEKQTFKIKKGLSSPCQQVEPLLRCSFATELWDSLWIVHLFRYNFKYMILLDEPDGLSASYI